MRTFDRSSIGLTSLNDGHYEITRVDWKCDMTERATVEMINGTRVWVLLEPVVDSEHSCVRPRPCPRIAFSRTRKDS